MNWVSKDNNEVEIFGYLPPPSRGRQTIWYLTVLEDGRGVPERHPKFRPEQEPMQELMVRLCVVCSRHFYYGMEGLPWFINFMCQACQTLDMTNKHCMCTSTYLHILGKYSLFIIFSERTCTLSQCF